MGKVEFQDFTVQVQNTMDDVAHAALEEACGELESQVKRNTKVGKVAGSQLKNKWKHMIITKNGEVQGIVGNPLERAIWYEFGTGDYALEGKGRKGGWYIPIGNGKNEISQAVVDAYGFKVVKGKGGKKFAHTYGMKPRRPLFKAYTTLKNVLIKHIQDKLKGGLS
jgi:hypothetical protein